MPIFRLEQMPVRDGETKTGQFKLEGFRQIWAIDIATHGSHRGERLEDRQHFFVADIASMQNLVNAIERTHQGRTDQTVRVGNNTEFHDSGFMIRVS